MQDVLEMQVVPLSSACGAEIKGVDLTKPLSRETVEAIRDAWNKHLVLVFRGQTITQDQQLTFASYFGDLGRRKKAPDKLRARAEGTQQDHEKVLLVSNIKDETACRSAPSARATSGSTSIPAIPPSPTSTRSSTRSNCRRPAATPCSRTCTRPMTRCRSALKQKLDGKRALHIHEYNRARQADASGDISNIPHYYHPVFVTHPYTGRKTLFVDRLMTTALEGFDPAESAAILDQLYDIGERREFIYEHVWQLGDFLMWDNRCTIHARTDFPKEERRLLRRCTVEGDPMRE